MIMSGNRYNITLNINGTVHDVEVDARRTLVDTLRDKCGLTGTLIGCEHGVCGACTVRVDCVAVRGCLMLAVQADGTDVVTIEGLSDSGEVADLQVEFESRIAAQCGYCTPGMMITSAELVDAGGTPTREDIRDHLSGNLCRCTGYYSIIEALSGSSTGRDSS